MRIPLTLLALTLSSPLALAQGGAAPSAPPSAPMGDPNAPPPDAPMDLPPGFDKIEPLSRSWKADETTADSAKKGAAALESLVKGYTAPAAIEDKVSLTMKVPGGDQKQDLSIAFGPAGAARIVAPGVTLTRLGDDLYFEPEDVTSKYMKVTKAGSLSDAISEAFGSAMLPLPEVQLRGGKAEEAAGAIGAMFVSNPKVVGFRAGSAGGPDVVLMKGDGGGEIEVSVDPKTSRLVTVNYSAVPPGAPEGLRIPIVLAVQSASFDKDLPTPIAFDAKGRKAVDSPDKLQATLDTGGEAPAFTMKDTDGKEVSLAALKGSVVVIDFWATWCGPCMKGLPKVDEFAKWAASSGKPIKVFGVNTMEEDEGIDDRMKKIGEFWKKKAFGFPTLIDADNSVSKAYGVQGIPYTVVIGPDGKVADVHMGFSPSIPEDLKKAAETALGGGAASGAGDKPSDKPAPANKG